MPDVLDQQQQRREQIEAIALDRVERELHVPGETVEEDRE